MVKDEELENDEDDDDDNTFADEKPKISQTNKILAEGPSNQ